MKDIYKPIIDFYKEHGVNRRFRRVKNGLWIFAEKSIKSAMPHGIFINKQDYERSGPEWTIKNYLMHCDDKLIRKVEGN
jgi:signal recognition particle receptor subunit beta